MTARSYPPPSVSGDWRTDVLESFRTNFGFGLLVLGYVAIARRIAAAFGDANLISVSLYTSLFSLPVLSLAMLFLAFRAIRILIIVRPEHPTKAILADIAGGVLSRRRLCKAVPMIFFLAIFSSVFTSLKAMIPVMHPYDWDMTLAHMDRVIHFGILPWEMLQPVLGYPITTGVINVFYNLWFFILASCWLWQAFSERDLSLRLQFFLTYMLSFIVLGNVVATFAASGGPCYYGRLVMGPDPFEPLMHYLHQASQHVPLVWSIAVQDMLWNRYTSNSTGMGSGISAMPSMHVAGATLFALLGWRVDRKLGIVLTAYLVIIMLGSVLLGWHYAVDGYVSIIGTILIWSAVGAILRQSRAVHTSRTSMVGSVDGHPSSHNRPEAVAAAPAGDRSAVLETVEA